MAINPYEKYRDQSITTMTQGEMVVRLYEEVIIQLNKAKKSIEAEDVSGMNSSLQKCQRILNHLTATLDFQYELSESLAWLYRYFIKRIMIATLKKDVEPLDEILPMVIDIKDTFAQGEKLSRIQS